MRIRDPGWNSLMRIWDPDEILWCGSGILDEILWCGSGIRMKFFDADPGSGKETIRIRDPGRKLYVSGIRDGKKSNPRFGIRDERLRSRTFNYYAPFLFDVVFTFRVFFPGSDLLRKRICFNCKMWLPVTNAGRKIRLNFPIMIRYSDLIDRYNRMISRSDFFRKKRKKISRNQKVYHIYLKV
jgi:hypothetical protein